MAAPFEDWYKNMPVVTKVYFTGCVITTLAEYLQAISVYDIYLSFDAVYTHHQV